MATEAKTKKAPKSKAEAAKRNIDLETGAARRLTPAELRAANAALPKDEKLKKYEGIVARGRTVFDDEGTKTAGMTVKASAKEIENLRRLGHLVDPSRPAAPIGQGPRFFKEDEASKGSEPPI